MLPNGLFTSEAVSAGHPDKVADRISDGVLDAFLQRDPHARVACETLVTANTVVLAGESRGEAPDYDRVVREAIQEIGYVNQIEPEFDARTVNILNHMHAQSAEIAQGVDAGARASEGAGDQGLMFGFAIGETPDAMPAPIYYAQKILQKLDARRKAGDVRLKPDAKSQLTLEYQQGVPRRVDTLLVSHQHSETLSIPELQEMVLHAARELFPDWLDAQTRVLINPTGSFINGGPATDTGLTGRKIIVDTYGGMARHGGGAFSGKDPTKVDRSAAYAARYLAKNVVAAKLAHACEIQLCYAIGVPEPLAIYVDTFGTEQPGVPVAHLGKILQQLVDLTPRGIRETLQLAQPIYAPTAAYGHFGRAPGSSGAGTFGWERTDLTERLLRAL